MYSRKTGPTAGERGAARTLELDIVAHTIPPQDLAQQVGAPVAELRDEMPELVSGIGDGQRLGAHGHQVPGQNRNASLACERVRIQAQAARQFYIQPDQARGRHRCWVYPGVEVLRQPRVRVFEPKNDGVAGA
jgi:hypothetical protein